MSPSIPMPSPGFRCRARADEDVVVFSGNMEYHPNLGAVRFFRAEVWPRAARALARARLAAGGQESRGGTAASPPATRASRSPARWTMPFANWRAPGWPWCRCWPAAARASKSWKPGRPACRWSPPPSARRVCRRAMASTFCSPMAARHFADAVTRVLENANLRRQLGQAGRLLLETEFTWDSAWKMLDW